MLLTDILSADRVHLRPGGSGPPSKSSCTKDQALRIIADLLGGHGGQSSADFFKVLREREAIQSTGIGDGVAIPHGAMDALLTQRAALLICPDGIPFDAIDGHPVRILFAVVGPKRATGEHLKVLARVSRLLRDAVFREKLLAAPDALQAFELIRAAEEGR